MGTPQNMSADTDTHGFGWRSTGETRFMVYSPSRRIAVSCCRHGTYTYTHSDGKWWDVSLLLPIMLIYNYLSHLHIDTRMLLCVNVDGPDAAQQLISYLTVISFRLGPSPRYPRPYNEVARALYVISEL